MKQKAISIECMTDGSIRKPSLDELNAQLELGWSVVSTTAVHVTGETPKAGDLLVILQK